MSKSRVPLYGKPQGFVTVDTDATAGATVGRDLRWPSGAVVTEAELRAAATPPGQGDYPVTYWRLVQEIPPNVVALAQTNTAGFYVVTGTGTSATRAIQARPGQLAVIDGDGVDGDPTLGLAEVADSGAGALLAIERDGFGRVSGTRAPTTDDLPEGADNLYFTTERAADAAPIQDILEGEGVEIDKTDPRRPVISATAVAVSLLLPFFLTDGSYAPIPLTSTYALPFFLSDGTRSDIQTVTA